MKQIEVTRNEVLDLLWKWKTDKPPGSADIYQAYSHVGRGGGGIGPVQPHASQGVAGHKRAFSFLYSCLATEEDAGPFQCRPAPCWKSDKRWWDMIGPAPFSIARPFRCPSCLIGKQGEKWSASLTAKVKCLPTSYLWHFWHTILWPVSHIPEISAAFPLKTFFRW